MRQNYRVRVLDDHYSHFGQEPEDGFLREAVRALGARGLLVYPHSMFGTVGNLVAHHQAAWDHEQPAPSAWILDVELPLGRHLHDDIRDGVGLARHLRAQGIQRPNRASQYRPIPIFFLTKFAIGDTVPNPRDPGSHQPLRQRIQDDVQVAWRFFRKSWADPGEPQAIEEAVDGPVQAYSLEQFAEAVWQAAEGAV